MSTCILRVAGTTGLEPGKPRTPQAQRVLDAVKAVPGVTEASMTARHGDPECEITICWEDGVDSAQAVHAARNAVHKVAPGTVFRGATWEGVR